VLSGGPASGRGNHSMRAEWRCVAAIYCVMTRLPRPVGSGHAREHPCRSHRFRKSRVQALWPTCAGISRRAHESRLDEILTQRYRSHSGKGAFAPLKVEPVRRRRTAAASTGCDGSIARQRLRHAPCGQTEVGGARGPPGRCDRQRGHRAPRTLNPERTVSFYGALPEAPVVSLNT
jgi:hypothetical protein